ncbi:MAG: helix-turn-helix domain-containing protein [Paludibacteraceae bacterium]
MLQRYKFILKRTKQNRLKIICLQFHTRLHMEYTGNLLLTTNVDISQIAYSSGFNSYPHFCTQFKSAMRMSPTAYRNKSAI